MRTIVLGVFRRIPSRALAAALISAALLGWTTPTRAGDLANVISDLYGGDGINLSQASGFGHDAHFRGRSLEGLDRLGDALSSGVGAYSFSSVITGFTFDPETGVPVRSSDSLGPLLAENATTLGKGRINLGLTYVHVKYSTFEGEDIDNLSLVLDHPDVNRDGQLAPFQPFPGGPLLDFELDKVRIDIDLDLEQDIFAHFGNFGITDRLDIGYIVPIIRTSAHASAVASVVDGSPGTPTPHFFDHDAEDPNSSTGGEKTGLGDIIVRTKYDLKDDAEKGWDYALGTQLALPTGREEDLMGTGEFRGQVLLIAAREFEHLLTHWNAGYEWVPDDDKLSNVRGIAGIEVPFTQKVTAAADLLARWEHSGDDIGDLLIDFAIGAKFAVVKDIVLSANVQVPVDDSDGLRADWIWFLGVEGSF